MPTFADTLRETLTPLTRSLLSHPFIVAIEAETLPRETLVRFAIQDLWLVDAAGRAFAAAAARAADEEERLRHLRGAIQEAEDRERLMALARVLGLDEARLCGAEPLPGCAALGHFLYWLCACAPAAQRRAAFAALQGVFSFMARRIAAGLRSQYGLGAGAVALFARHAERAPDDPLEWLASPAAQGEDEAARRAILAGARQALAFEKMFFDAVIAADAAAWEVVPEEIAAGSGEVFAERLRAECEPLRRACTEHPFVRRVEAGAVPPAAVRVLAEQALWRRRESLRLAGFALSRAADARAQEAILERLRGGTGRDDAVQSLARALGSPHGEREAAEPLAGAMAFPNFLWWITAFGEPAERATPLQASEDVWATIAGRLAEGLAAHYSLPPAAVDPFAAGTAFAPDERMGAGELASAAEAAVGCRVAIRRAARLAYRYERLFFDSILVPR
jgi:thiaminase